MTAPTVFISYSHDNANHKAWVADLAGQLRSNGVEVILDQWDLVPGADVVAFMERGVSTADKVLMICSEDYVRKAESGVGGVGYERLIVSKEIYEKIDTTKFIPLIRNNKSPEKTPGYIGARLYVDFTDDSAFNDRFQDLLHAVHNVPAVAKPPLGPSPFSGILPTAVATPVINVSSGQVALDWFDQQAKVANQGLAKMGRTAAMELRFALHGTEQWSQLTLVNAVRQAEIRTFGWPIGIVLDRDDWGPKPRNDGVYAEVAITDKGFTQSKAYDYWAFTQRRRVLLASELLRG